MSPIKSFAAAALLSVACASQAAAHAKLVESNPAASATVAAPKQIVLRFNEKLEAKFSGFDLSVGGAKTPVKTSVGGDGVTMIGAPAKPLAAGAYKVDWHAVTADGHRMQGSYGFTVR
jgi:copper resistance protein C